MTALEPSATLGALVAERPARAAVFERLRLDYCCGGGQTLADACASRGLRFEAVQEQLAALDRVAADDRDLELRDWRSTSIAELVAHIVAIHHGPMRESFPRIERLLQTVVRVHGSGHPELAELQLVFGRLREELEPHLESEETVLFPACVAAERGGAAVDEELLAEHEVEHAGAGDMLAALRSLAADYEPERALCNTHRSLLAELSSFERDLHQHIHEENNVLMPRTRELSRRDPLPRCCRSWIAEQARGWR